MKRATGNGRSKLDIWIAALAIALLVAVVAGAGRVVAQSDDAATTSPLLGSWIMLVDGDPSLLTISAGGGIVDIESNREVGIGSWKATDTDSADITLVIPGEAPEFGFAGTYVIRGAIDVDTATDTFTLTFNLTGVSTDGTPTFDDSGTASVRLPIEGVDKAMSPLAGYPALPAEATPAS